MAETLARYLVLAVCITLLKVSVGSPLCVLCPPGEGAVGCVQCIICDHGYYSDTLSRDDCTSCSQCDGNTFISTPCTATSDVICGSCDIVHIIGSLSDVEECEMKTRILPLIDDEHIFVHLVKRDVRSSSMEETIGMLEEEDLIPNESSDNLEYSTGMPADVNMYEGSGAGLDIGTSDRIISQDITSHDMTSQDMTSQDMMSQDMTSQDITSFSELSTIEEYIMTTFEESIMPTTEEPIIYTSEYVTIDNYDPTEIVDLVKENVFNSQKSSVHTSSTLDMTTLLVTSTPSIIVMTSESTPLTSPKKKSHITKDNDPKSHETVQDGGKPPVAIIVTVVVVLVVGVIVATVLYCKHRHKKSQTYKANGAYHAAATEPGDKDNKEMTDLSKDDICQQEDVTETTPLKIHRDSGAPMQVSVAATELGEKDNEEMIDLSKADKCQQDDVTETQASVAATEPDEKENEEMTDLSKEDKYQHNDVTETTPLKVDSDSDAPTQASVAATEPGEKDNEEMTDLSKDDKYQHNDVTETTPLKVDSDSGAPTQASAALPADGT